MLAILRTPNLFVTEVDIDFTMEVKSSTSSKDSSSSSASVSASASVGWGPFSASVEISGSVASSKENTRSSDNSAKYNVRVRAEDRGPSEGLMKVLDMLNTAITPVATTTT